jgi:transcriptional regulator with XRE-family HTH domain
MRLRQYLKKENMTVTEFAKRLNVHKNHIFMIINGSRRPSIHLAREIETLTDKYVTIDDLIEKRAPKEVKCPNCGEKIC